MYRRSNPTAVFLKAKEFGISFSEARMHRIEYLESCLIDFTARLKEILELTEKEPGDKEFLKHLVDLLQSKINSTELEIKSFKNPIQKPPKQIDWAKATQVPCVDLLGEPVRKSGKEWIYHSPLRNDKNPSFSVNIEKNLWHDLATNEGGDVISLAAELNRCSKTQAAKILTQN
jgi:hypothetical protein